MEISENDIGLVRSVDFTSHQNNENTDKLHVTTEEKQTWNGKADNSDLVTHKNAEVLAHPDGSVTEAKIADGAVTEDKLGEELKENYNRLLSHLDNDNNPHSVNAEQTGAQEQINTLMQGLKHFTEGTQTIYENTSFFDGSGSANIGYPSIVTPTVGQTVAVKYTPSDGSDSIILYAEVTQAEEEFGQVMPYVIEADGITIEYSSFLGHISAIYPTDWNGGLEIKDAVSVYGQTVCREYVDSIFGSIDTVLTDIISMQNTMLGGEE